MFVGKLKTTYLLIALLGAAYLLLITITSNSYYQLMLTLVPIWAVMGLSWNIFSGYSGLVSFGHAVFFGLGAYTTAILAAEAGLTPWLGIPIAGLAGSLAGILVGAITFRLRGHYFSLAMLAYPLALLHVFEWAGYQELSVPMRRESAAAFMQFSDQRWYAVIALVLMIFAMLISIRTERSRFGFSLLSIKQNELAAEAAGIDSFRWKLRAIAVSGALAGAAGGLYAIVLLVVTPGTVFGLQASALALIVTMFGGVGTVWGPVVGAAVLIPLSEVLHAELGSVLPGIQGVVFGAAIILVIMTMPQGIVWAVRDRFVKRARRQGVALLAAGPEPAASLHPIGEPIMTLEGVSRHFGGVRALTDVSMTVNRGEILGIIGPNGAGKTTLFNNINGLIIPDHGSIHFLGKPLQRQRPNRICALGIGRTFQVARPFPRMTLLENVTVGAYVKAASDEEAVALARGAIARLGLESQEETLASELTNYELRLMELARAIASDPVLLMLDEPFAGLASTEVASFMSLIRRLRADGVTIVIIEHTMYAMVKLVDRFVVLDHGVVIASGTPDTVVKDERVVKAYLGDKWVADAVD